MSELKIGCAALSKAGRDKGRFFAVIGTDGEYALLADGMLRMLEKPKRKKIKHMQATDTVFSQEELSSNKMLKAAIRERFHF